MCPVRELAEYLDDKIKSRRMTLNGIEEIHWKTPISNEIIRAVQVKWKF